MITDSGVALGGNSV